MDSTYLLLFVLTNIDDALGLERRSEGGLTHQLNFKLYRHQGVVAKQRLDDLLREFDLQTSLFRDFVSIFLLLQKK